MPEAETITERQQQAAQQQKIDTEAKNNLFDIVYNKWNEWAAMNDVSYMPSKEAFDKDGRLLPVMTTRVLDTDSPEAAAYGARLTQEVDLLDSAYAEFNAQWCPYTSVKIGRGADGQPVENIEFSKEIDKLNTLYQRQMLMTAVHPLLNGVSPQNIASTIGLSIGMMFASKDFRDSVVQSIRKMGEKKLEKKIEKHGLTDKLLKKENKLIAGDNGGRLPFTAKSAAEQQIAFMQKLYRDIRDPNMGKNNETMETLTTQCMQACAIVNAMAQADGVSEKSINRNVRKIVSHMSHQDPTMARYFDELAGQDTRSLSPIYGALKSITRQGDVYTRTDTPIWDGAYVDNNGQDFAGSFHVRPPQTKEYWKAQYSDVLDEQMSAMQQTRKGEILSPDTFGDIFPNEIGEGIFHNDGSTDQAHDIDFSLQLICDSVVDDTCGAEPHVYDKKYIHNKKEYKSDLQDWLDRRAEVLKEFQDIFDQKREDLLYGDGTSEKPGLLAQWKEQMPEQSEAIDRFAEKYERESRHNKAKNPFAHTADEWIEKYHRGSTAKAHKGFSGAAKNYYSKYDKHMKGKVTHEQVTPENEDTRRKATRYNAQTGKDEEIPAPDIDTNDMKNDSEGASSEFGNA